MLSWPTSRLGCFCETFPLRTSVSPCTKKKEDFAWFWHVGIVFLILMKTTGSVAVNWVGSNHSGRLTQEFSKSERVNFLHSCIHPFTYSFIRSLTHSFLQQVPAEHQLCGRGCPRCWKQTEEDSRPGPSRIQVEWEGQFSKHTIVTYTRSREEPGRSFRDYRVRPDCSVQGGQTPRTEDCGS